MSQVVSRPRPLSNGRALWFTAMGGVASLLVAVSLAASLMRLPRADVLLLAAVLAVIVFVVLRSHLRATPNPSDLLCGDVLDSAGAALLTIGLDGQVSYLNPAGERLLGYHAAEFKREWDSLEILAPGESYRLTKAMQRLCGLDLPIAEAPPARIASYLDCVRSLPPSMVPSFEARLRCKDGSLITTMLHISALRDPAGNFQGMVAVAMNQKAAVRQQNGDQETLEQFHDLFNNASEMIAILSVEGRFLCANPAWERCFGLDQAALLGLESFDQMFQGSCREEAAKLLRRVLNGESVERVILSHYLEDGRRVDLELSLSLRVEVGKPRAVRCVMHEVTQQRQREQQLALQLAVSQIVSENAAPEVAAMRILEALCVLQGWDLAIAWQVDAKENRLEFATAWGIPGRQMQSLIQNCIGEKQLGPNDLADRAWKSGRAVWLADLHAEPPSAHIDRALQYGMLSGWAVPVRVGSTVLAVLEFYSSNQLRENHEALEALETAATSLGQILVQTRELGRTAELTRQQKILLDAVTDGICGVDRQRRVSFANPAAARLLGITTARMTGQPVHELLHGNAPAERRCEESCTLRCALENRQSAAGEIAVYRAAGTAFPAEYSLTPILDKGRYWGSVLSFRDISQRSALDRMKDEFISTVSHELRTPLTSIRGALGLLSSGILGQLNAKGEHLLHIALTNSERLVHLINDILDLEKIQSGREPLAFRPVQIAEVVRQSIDGVQPVAEAAGVQLIHDATQAEIMADPDRLLQVMTNLLSNAIKFSPPNSTVSVMLRPEDTGVTLSVIDHGRGIPEDKLEAIFGRFQQVDASDSRQKGGSGLGLAICRTIVAQHCGKIWAERNPVRGSTFRMYLPYRPQPEDGSAVAQNMDVNCPG